MTPLTARQRSLRASLAAERSWANTADRAARTAKARQASIDRFEKLVDPNGELPAEVRAQRAAHLRRSHLLAMSLRSARVRAARRAAASTPDGGDAG